MTTPTEPNPTQPNPTPTEELLKKKSPKRSSRRAAFALGIAGVIAVGGIAFAVGRLTAPALPTGFPGGFQNGGANGFQPPGGGNPNGGGFGGGPNGGGFLGGAGPGLTGIITSVDGDTLTIETENGTTVSVTLHSDTTYSREVDADKGDLSTGDEVRVGLDLGSGFDPGSDQVDASSVTLVSQ